MTYSRRRSNHFLAMTDGVSAAFFYALGGSPWVVNSAGHHGGYRSYHSVANQGLQR